MNEPELNELQRDAITELLNIGVGRAAAASPRREETSPLGRCGYDRRVRGDPSGDG